MATIIKTTSEFSSRRKIKYNDDNLTKPKKNLTLDKGASLSTHKSFYGKDKENNDAYFIEFNIGDFNFE